MPFASFIAIQEERLPEAPEAFQRYVRDWFRKECIFGQSVFAACQTLDVPKKFRGGPDVRGAAPCHSVDLAQYYEGLESGMTLGTWIEAAIKKGLIYSYHVGWADPSIGSLIDF